MFWIATAITVAPISGGASCQRCGIRCHGTSAIATASVRHSTVVSTATPPEPISSGCVSHSATPPAAPSPKPVAPTARNVLSSPGRTSWFTT